MSTTHQFVLADVDGEDAEAHGGAVLHGQVAQPAGGCRVRFGGVGGIGGVGYGEERGGGVGWGGGD